MDMSTTVAPKSNQTNADDLIAGPRTITITKVVGTGNPEQPVAVSYEDDAGKPYIPCKSMRRVMIAIWGADASQYIGRAMTIYRDAKVAFGGMEVGGIRISHMSHIERDMTMALTVTKAKRAPFVVKPLAVAKKADKAADGVRALIQRIEATDALPALMALTTDAAVMKQRTWLAENRADLAQKVDAAVEAALGRLSPPADDADFPGDRPLESAA